MSTTDQTFADRYVAACHEAATRQGLNPLSNAARSRAAELEEAGISYDVEQTGGFTMVAVFYFAESAITCTHEGEWLVMLQPREQWETGEGEAWTELSRPGMAAEEIVTMVLALAITRES